ncbi:hypothetical protein ACFPYJ_17970 [Paenibacillus solisilvae]|uniref:Uncharacterized protein n=1 Tax=Paenibacillus solisilvae TaxID=2486751 RepID=A0ABW0VYL9_9BACL
MNIPLIYNMLRFRYVYVLLAVFMVILASDGSLYFFSIFIPVTTPGNGYFNPANVVTMVYDYREVTNQLYKRLYHFILILIAAFAVSKIMLILVNRIIGRTKEDAIVDGELILHAIHPL